MTSSVEIEHILHMALCDDLVTTFAISQRLLLASTIASRPLSLGLGVGCAVISLSSLSHIIVILFLVILSRWLSLASLSGHSISAYIGVILVTAGLLTAAFATPAVRLRRSRLIVVLVLIGEVVVVRHLVITRIVLASFPGLRRHNMFELLL